MLKIVRKIYEGILVDSVCRVTEDLIGEEQGAFMAEDVLNKFLL